MFQELAAVLGMHQLNDLIAGSDTKMRCQGRSNLEGRSYLKNCVSEAGGLGGTTPQKL